MGLWLGESDKLNMGLSGVSGHALFGARIQVQFLSGPPALSSKLRTTEYSEDEAVTSIRKRA
jgi:hypothetical protein